VLVLLAAVMLAVGSLWWVKSAPRTTVEDRPTTNPVLIQLEDGAILTYAGKATDNIADLRQIITSDWPCRPDESDGQPGNMMDNQTLQYVPQNGAQVIRLPRCSAQSRPGR
jgi:hypothetical protein